jgi:hypothetical protein
MTSDKPQDTHGVSAKPWIGFALDGTVAIYRGGQGIDDIGGEIRPMVELIRALHRKGMCVKIVTARVAPREQPETKPNPFIENNWTIRDPGKRPWLLKPEWTALEFVQEWCQYHLGFVPEITHQKDHLMLWLVDDRTVQVEPNTGRILGRLPADLNIQE